MKENRKNNRRKLRRMAALLLAVLVCCSSASFPEKAYADSKINELKDEYARTQQEIKDKKADIEKQKASITELNGQLSALDKEIYALQVDIKDIQTSINSTKAVIVEKLDELDKIQAEMDRQDQDLDLRLRTMYKNGGVGMLSVLFGSRSMSDLLTNIEMIKRIYASDEELLEKIRGQYAEVEEVKEELVALKELLVSQEADLKSEEAQLEKAKNNMLAKKSQVETDMKALEQQVDAMNADAAALQKEIVRLQSISSYVGGTMQWPASASQRVTSKFGMRNHPILHIPKLHTGIDIGAPYGTNIVAANGGKVISAGWHSSYGYMVMIDHGGGIVTLYAHSCKLLVSKGQTVSKGQVIALVGSTGMSTGAHLHFEVRVNGVYKDPLQAAYLGVKSN